MKKEDLIDAIGRIDGKYVVEAEQEGKVKKPHILKISKYQTWISLAACLCILVLVGLVGSLRINSNKEETTMDSSAAVTSEDAAQDLQTEAESQDTDTIRDETTDKMQSESAWEEMSAEKLSQPPQLMATYIYNKTEIAIESNTYSWGDEVKDFVHPLNAVYDDTNTVYLSKNAESDTNVIELNFEVEPDRVDILYYWKADTKPMENGEYDKAENYVAEVKTEKPNQLVPKTDGDYIYELVAYWNQGDESKTANYCIKTVAGK